MKSTPDNLSSPGRTFKRSRKKTPFYTDAKATPVPNTLKWSHHAWRVPVDFSVIAIELNHSVKSFSVLCCLTL